MHKPTGRMLRERKSLESFLRVLLKDESQELLALQIHNVVSSSMAGGRTLSGTLAVLDGDLRVNPVRVSTGDNMGGWKTRSKFLTDRQRANVLAAVRLVYECGGRFEWPDAE